MSVRENFTKEFWKEFLKRLVIEGYVLVTSLMGTAMIMGLIFYEVQKWFVI